VKKASVEVRVIYGDTDQMGVVYYGNYLRYFEAARGALIRASGVSYGDIERSGYLLPVHRGARALPAAGALRRPPHRRAHRREGARGLGPLRLPRHQGRRAPRRGVHRARLPRPGGRPARIPAEMRRMLEVV
jgi:hypothetical protein